MFLFDSIFICYLFVVFVIGVMMKNMVVCFGNMILILMLFFVLSVKKLSDL